MNESTKTAPSPPSAGGDPSMEDILASIRRILSEDEAAPPAGERPAAPSAGAAQPAAGEDVLDLDAAMMVPDGSAPAEAQDPQPPAPDFSLVGPEAEAAAVTSVAALLRTLASDRALQVRSTGPTIEDLVRQGLRPLLKEWLDANLPALVERLVRAEIERVVGRAMH